MPAKSSKTVIKTKETQPKYDEKDEKIDWPRLTPLTPLEDLCLETIAADQIVVIRKLFTKRLCQQLVSFLSNLPLQTTPGVPKKGEAVRVNDRFQVHDDEFARTLWEETPLKAIIEDSATTQWGGTTCGLNPRIRVYRYRPGQFFGQHYDESEKIVFKDSNGSRNVRTTWTLLIYLTGPATGCFGGETVFYPDEPAFGAKSSKSSNTSEPILVAPEEGMALFHKHGDDCMLHEGKEVTAGEKWIIRSDLCVTS